MRVEELINYLENNGFNIGNIKISDYYKENKEVKVKVGLYTRLSKRDDIVIERQLMTLRRYIGIRMGINASEIKEYSDNGFSGTRRTRPNYERMKRDLKIGEINTIMTTDVDRFGRDVGEVLSNLYPDGKVEHIYICLDKKFINAPSNRDFIRDESMNADVYASTCSIKARRGIRTSMENGSVISSKPLYGYNIIKDDYYGIKKFVLGDSLKVSIVKEIFNLYLTGHSISEISKIIINKNIESPSGNKKWSKSTIESILKNPLYTGELLQGRYEKLNYTYYGDGLKIKKKNEKDWIRGGEFEGIIDKTTFDTVQRMLKENISTKTSSGNRKLFTGILKCGDCGRALIYKEKAKGYKCSASQRKDGGCTTHLVKEDDLYRLIKPKIIAKVLENKTIIESKIVERVKRETLSNHNKNRVAKIEKDMEKAIEKLADIYLEETTIIQYSEKIFEGIKRKIDNLENEKNIIIDEMKNEELIEKQITKRLDNIERIIKAENWIFKLFIKKIIIYQEGKIEIEWRC